MFDNYNVEPGRAVPYEKSVTVTERRAPTDESVKLLREMEAAARESIVSTYRTEPNEAFHVAAVSFAEPHGGQTLHIAFTLNGDEHRAQVVIPLHKALTASDVAAHFREAFANAVMREIALPVARELRLK